MNISETAPSAIGRIPGKRNYDLRFIKQVVQEIEEGLPALAAAVEYGLDGQTLGTWLNKYASAAYLQQRKKKTSAQIKRSVARAIEQGAMTIKEARVAHGVTGNTIKAWLAACNGENDDLSGSNLPELRKKKAETIPVKSDVPPEIKVLQEQLAYATLKIAALNTLIDVAEEQLKINIRKKPGTRQL